MAIVTPKQRLLHQPHFYFSIALIVAIAGFWPSFFSKLSTTDSAHLAFSKLFVETEIDPALNAIIATRRPSAPDDPTPWLFHLALTSAPEPLPRLRRSGCL